MSQPPSPRTHSCTSEGKWGDCSVPWKTISISNFRSLFYFIYISVNPLYLNKLVLASRNISRSSSSSNTYCSTDVVYSMRSICKKKDLFISWNREIDPSFEKGLRGGKHAKNLKIFWMNIQTIIEFVWCEKLCWSWRLFTNMNDWSSVTKERIDETHRWHLI